MNELDTKQKVKLANILMDKFNTGDWQELFTVTDCLEFPQQKLKVLSRC